MAKRELTESLLSGAICIIKRIWAKKSGPGYKLEWTNFFLDLHESKKPGTPSNYARTALTFAWYDVLPQLSRWTFLSSIGSFLAGPEARVATISMKTQPSENMFALNPRVFCSMSSGLRMLECMTLENRCSVSLNTSCSITARWSTRSNQKPHRIVMWRALMQSPWVEE